MPARGTTNPAANNANQNRNVGRGYGPAKLGGGDATLFLLCARADPALPSELDAGAPIGVLRKIG